MSPWSKKSVHELQASAAGEHGLRRTLGPWSLTLLGIGATIGAGIFVLTGTAAANYAGPALSLSFVLAGLGCLCAALCYAELAAMIPAAGSAYTYAFVAMGELVAWLVGWNLVLEYLVTASTVAVGWSAYLKAVLAGLGVHLPESLTTAPLMAGQGFGIALSGAVLNLPALIITSLLGLFLVIGIRESATANNLMVYVKVGVVLLVIACGIPFVDPANWQPFLPENTGEFGRFGATGVLQAAGVIFFAYIGFDTVSTTAQESRNPGRDMPLSLLVSLGVCAVLYVAMAMVMTGVVHYSRLNVANPVSLVIAEAGPVLGWLGGIVSLGIIVGLASAILAALLGQSRVLYSMARDGLVPAAFARVHPKYRTPFTGTVVITLLAGLIGALFPIDILGELVSIGTLFAFAVVCASVLILRRTQPEIARPFRTPWFPVVPVLGILSCVLLMYALPNGTWFRFAIWCALGLALYGLTALRRRARAANTPPAREREFT
jgi:APA family basic amino acid/polyamine antiporter